MKDQLGVETRSVSLELVLFDKARAVAKLLCLDPGRLPVGKTRVKQFDIKGTACSDIACVLLNDVRRCEGQGLTLPGCHYAFHLSSRLAIPFLN